MLNSLRVLIVDDNADAADALAHLLKLWGYVTKAAYTGQTAIDIAGTFQPHAVNLDISMPGMHGGKIAAFLRSRPETSSALIIAATGNEVSDSRLDGSREHFDNFLRKPCNLRALEGLLAAHAASTNNSF